MMVQSHRETCMDAVEGILCIEFSIQYLLGRDNDVLKDDVVLGQIVILAQVGGCALLACRKSQTPVL